MIAAVRRRWLSATAASVMELAVEFGVSKRTIYRAIRSAKPPQVAGLMGRNMEIRRLRASGVSPGLIAVEFGLSEGSIITICRSVA